MVSDGGQVRPFVGNPIIQETSGSIWMAGNINDGTNMVSGASTPNVDPEGFIEVFISGTRVYLAYYISG